MHKEVENQYDIQIQQLLRKIEQFESELDLIDSHAETINQLLSKQFEDSSVVVDLIEKQVSSFVNKYQLAEWSKKVDLEKLKEINELYRRIIRDFSQ